MAPASAPVSERAILAAVLQSQAAYTETARRISTDDWYLPAHASLWQAVRDLQEAGNRADAPTVMQEVVRREGAGHHQLHHLVAQLVTEPMSGSLGYHLDQVVECHTAREVADALDSARQEMEMAEPGQAVTVAERGIQALRLAQQLAASEEASATESDVLDLVERSYEPERWVLPDLLAVGDRFMLTAPEGYGKSTLLRQFACCAAAGWHPFDRHAIEPKRVLVVDAENPDRVNQMGYRSVLDFLDVAGVMPHPGMLTVDVCGERDLLDPRDAARLYAQVERIKPELVIIGPVYKLHRDDPNDEGTARRLVGVLERVLRMGDGCAMVIEAHTPHSEQVEILRPYGASLWKRWPEFGFCLHPDKTANQEDQRLRRLSKLTPWRGSRSVRKWPQYLAAGSRLPWESE
jgi:hypothetical protein